MAARPIGQDPRILGGRRHVAGTLIAVANLRRDLERSGSHVRPVYREMGLTDGEIDVALKIVFPSIRLVRVAMDFVNATVHCECGEHTRVITSSPELELVHCICGRTWQLPTEIQGTAQEPSTSEPAHDQTDASHGISVGYARQPDEPGEPQGISKAATIVVRAQQSVDRWMVSQFPGPFAGSMSLACQDLWESRPTTDAERDAFCQVAEAIHIGKGHAFENQWPLLEIARRALR